MITQTLTCGFCGNVFDRTGYPSYFRLYKKAYCSKRCALLGAREEYRPAQYVVVSQSGHIWVRIPHHPNRNKNNQVPLAHLIMELELGRYLLSDEVVHHIDGNPSNNIVSNLIVMTLSEHVTLHNKLKQRGDNGQFLKKVP